MGEQKVNRSFSDDKKAYFIKHLLDDVAALEYMIANDMIEKGITRIGAEQEFCLVSRDWRPSSNNIATLKEIDDPHFTTELAKYNLEINLDPFELKEDSFSRMETQLKSLLDKAARVVEAKGDRIILTGILPTVSKTHLDISQITPFDRYYALNDMLMSLRGSHFQLHLHGVDELSITHDSVLFEACNTSFQAHLQIEPSDFVSSYNWSQAITGPVLGVCCNSPLLLGRELWSETRIALFRQSIDTRNLSQALKDQQPRVSFGTNWATGSVADIYKENISKYKIILSSEIDERSLEILKEGKIPELKALNLHSGTIYPWNRACYGVGKGKPHLRIENRYLPAGPSVIDEMANFAFWVGVMMGRPKKYDNLPATMDFREAKSNFVKAARYGKDAIMAWDGYDYSVKKLVQKVLLPIAYEGLDKAGVDQEDIQRLLSVIDQRSRGNTGSKWMVSNYRRLNSQLKKDKSLRLLTKYTYKNQQLGLPVHRWPDADETDPLKESSRSVSHIMSTRVFTVLENDLATLATRIMEWNNIHHVPVEDGRGNLSGVLTWSHATKFHQAGSDESLLVSDIMEKDVISIPSVTPIQEAIRLMKEKEVGCLPVTQNDELVGIVTIKDVISYDHD